MQIKQSDIARHFPQEKDMPWMKTEYLTPEAEEVQEALQDYPLAIFDVKAIFQKTELTPGERAFLDTFSLPLSPHFRIMVYCIAVLNSDILSLEMKYEEKKCFLFQVILKHPDKPKETITFNFDDIYTAVAIRSFGIMKIDNKPVFEGYFSS